MIPISYEFFPPQTEEGLQNLLRTQNELLPTHPAYFSMTYGAGGTTQKKTLAAVATIIQNHPTVPVAPHLTCVGSTKATIAELLRHYQDSGINRLVVLRGDLPMGAMGRTAGDFRYARDLVRFIRAETGQHFHIVVAAYPEMHPEAQSLSADIGHFIDKVEAGADSAITQFFFSTSAYSYFCNKVRQAGVKIPIIPGIMTINNFSQLTRFATGCGAEIPRYVQKAMEGANEDEQRSIGVDITAQLCQQLIAIGAPALHFYTLNRSTLSLAVQKQLQG